MKFQLDLKRSLISFDLETTGIDVQNDRIVDIGIVELTPEGERVKVSQKINPGRPIPADAMAVHHITDEMVADAPLFKDVARMLLDKLEGCDITGYNVVAFDVPLLAAEFARCGLKWPSPAVQIIDAYSIYKVQESHTLTRALAFYTGRDLGDAAHDATADAEAALDVLVGQGKHYRKKTLADLAPLALQPDWADSTGKVRWVNGQPTINFGKWSGKTLKQVPRAYFDWILKQDFPEDFKVICRNVLKGVMLEQSHA